MISPVTSRNSKTIFYVLAMALIVRGLFLILLPDQNLPDAVAYRTAAGDFRHLHLMVNNDIMPLYSLMIAIVGDGWGQKLADLALSLATVWLVYEIALRIYHDQIIALAAALFCAFWPNFAFFTAVGMTETLFVTLVLAAFLCLYDRHYVLGSIFLVLGILTRPAIEILAPFLVVLFSVLIHREALRVVAKRVVIYALVYVALMAPWWLHNYARYHQFVHLNLAAGMVLYSGNNPINLSGGGVAPKDVDVEPFAKFTNPLKRDAAFKKAAIDYIKSNPWHFVAMMPVKFSRLWQPWPYTDEFQGTLTVIVSIVAAVPAFMLALAGLVLTLRPFLIRLLPCLVYLGYLTLVHMVTFGSVRYRVPLEPFILMFAAAGLVELLRRVRVLKPALESSSH
jgi:4-amino-4-deoxy-L-arabinose transferase-like glycosyltransferase